MMHFLWALLCVFCECAALEPKGEKSPASATIDAYQEAFNRHDAKGMADLWAEQGRYGNPISEQFVEGKENLLHELEKWFTVKNADKLEYKSFVTQTLNSKEVIESGRFKIQFKDGKPPLESAIRILLVDENGKWRIKEIRAIDTPPSKNHLEELKDLTWLIGNWKDADEDSVIESSAKWDLHQNFILQHFTIKVFDQTVTEVKQIIAWDPVNKRIRSWAFDSDGGFGEGRWSKKGNSWHVDSSFTLADGERGSAIHIYTPIDKDTYTWASEGRDINGVILPNIAPVTVKRVQGEEK